MKLNSLIINGITVSFLIITIGYSIINIIANKHTNKISNVSILDILLFLKKFKYLNI